MTDKSFSVGEPCFAKVKGYPAWPAEVTVIGGGKFEVFFFGTHEIARLTAKDLFKANEANIDKFSHPKMKARKWYKEGLAEMMNLLQRRKTSIEKVPRTPTGSKALAITTPTKIPAIRSKEYQEDSSLSPVVLLDTRAVEKANPTKSAGNPKGKSKAMPSPLKKNNINKASIKNPAAAVPDSNESPETDPYKRVLPTVTPSKRQIEKAIKEAGKSPTENVEEDEETQSPASARKGSKRQPESSVSPSKKQKASEPIKMNININLEMSAETFLRVARELPGLLNLASANIGTGVNIEI
eukprot:TRINITY_DN22466_c0_g1_i1.p1 TRINITY_DN22466_c0_g1~~TRINITY_DN22466_c0_g1_i1.p1  ORF type:complete len:297 (-),score=103.98 TRINITY_DN22466_c0_g1_i1:111-1001(-)